MLKPILRDQTVSIISIMDSAIDHEGSDKQLVDGDEWLTYARDRIFDVSSWRQTVKFKSGEQPTEFIMGIMPPAELARVAPRPERRRGDGRPAARRRARTRVRRHSAGGIPRGVHPVLPGRT